MLNLLNLAPQTRKEGFPRCILLCLTFLSYDQQSYMKTFVRNTELDMVVYIFTPSTWKAEGGKSL